MAKVALVSLGCPKNLVDSEHALGTIRAGGHELVVEQSQADLIVINTCGFIESAREESLEEIRKATLLKRQGKCKGVVVMGCLAQRLGEDLEIGVQGIDAILGLGDASGLAGVIENVLDGGRVIKVSPHRREWEEPGGRVLSTPSWTAYLKLSDGCRNRCSYCAIPDIRGPYRSRPANLAVKEARMLAAGGVKELVLVGQDLTDYGSELGDVSALPRLLESLCEIEGVHWIRLMYCYPTKITAELAQTIASLKKVVKYIDVPLQHSDQAILHAMNRNGSAEEYLRLIDTLREAVPEIAIRSTFIVGFPGETSEQFNGLLRFLREARLDRAGAFIYSSEEGTPAAAMAGAASLKTVKDRMNRLMRLQQNVSLGHNRALVGRQMEVLIEGTYEDGMYGRSYRDAPEIDGLVYVAGSKSSIGEFITARITHAREYDLVSKEESSL